MSDGNWPPPVDSLPVGVDDPPNYHHRRLTAEGHPLMGSSPAEREESRQRGERLRAESMRGHPFVGDGPYCEARISFSPMGSAETGIVTGWSGCGWSPEMHP
jgi:hypothetical protein